MQAGILRLLNPSQAFVPSSFGAPAAISPERDGRKTENLLLLLQVS